MNSISRISGSFAVPIAVLAAAYFIVARAQDLPPSLAGLRVYGAYVLFALGMIVSFAFRRGRVLAAILSLAIAYLAYSLTLQYGLKTFPARTAFAALSVFVPFNLGALSLLRERGVFTTHGLQRIAVMLLQVAFTAWVVFSRRIDVTEWAYLAAPDAKLSSALRIPQAGLVMMGLAFIAGVSKWYISRSAIDLGLAATIVAFGIAMNRVASPDAFAVFSAAGALILTIAVLQDTFRMAFRDELTGLPSRRALNEQLAGLGRRYAIAMLDVDRFKDFNDTYGHDLGDQVLKMVATRLADVGGGGKAYRYGGEEFTVLFPGKSSGDAMPYLQALRRDIAGYEMAVRNADRRARENSDLKNRGRRRAGASVSVTVSIGLAERNDRFTTPEDVIHAADKALYRAKNKGRNQVSR